jgi:CRP-like cAMP-binding protein
MFIIVEGHVEAYLETSPARSIRFGPGQVFGELAMLTRSKRVVNCRALADSRLAFLTRQGLAKLMKVEPELSVRLLYNLSQFLSLTLLKTINDLKKVP